MKTFSRTYYDVGWSVQQTADCGYIIAVETGENNGDIWVIKTNEHGTKRWDQIFGGSRWDARPNVKQTNDNGYIITARTWSIKGDYTMKAKAKDCFNHESDWATLIITMPYIHNIPVLQYWDRVFQWFPNAFLIL